MLTPPNTFLSRTWNQGKRSLRFRQTLFLSLVILLLMGILASIMLQQQRSALYHAAEAQGLAFTQAFAIGGGAAFENNLYRIQETLMNTHLNPNILGIEIIDRDNLIIASQTPSQIGLTVNDSGWLALKDQNAEVFQKAQGPNQEPLLLMVAPLPGQEETPAWIRVTFSLKEVQQEETQLIVRMSLITILLICAGILSIHWSQQRFSAILRRVVDQLHEALDKLKFSLRNIDPAPFRAPDPPESKSPEQGDVEHLEQTVTTTIELLKTQSQALQTSATQLEQKVHDRTRALEEAKQSLEREIQDRLIAQEQLERISRQNQLILNSAGEGIYGLDLQGHVTFINPVGASLLGYEVEELLGQPMHDRLHAPEKTSTSYSWLDCPIHGHFLQGKSQQGSNQILRRKDGTTFPVEFISTPIYDNTKITGAVITFTDITTRKELEAHTREGEVRIRQSQKMEAIGTLAGGIAHDFNNILTAILGFGQLAQLKTSPNHQTYQYLGQILNAGKRAKDLIKQILTFSRQSEPVHQPIEFRALIAEVLGLMKATLPSTIEIREHFAHVSGQIWADPTQIHQVLINLFTNAEYAMRGNPGVLSIHLEQMTIHDEQRLKALDLLAGPYFHLRVIDNGSGIPPDVLHKIFDPFFTTKEQGSGTGMGLSVAHGIMLAHNGNIKVDSILNEGTTVHLYLPYIELKAPSIPLEQQGWNQAQSQAHIVFVDDEESLALMGQHLLEYLGYKVTAFTSPEQALEFFRAHPDHIDAVITDQTMPKMTGEHLSLALLAIRPDLPVILYSGFTHTLTQERAEEIGIRRILAKPILMHDLATVLEQVLPQKA